MHFTVCQNSIGKYDFGSMALYATWGVTGGQKPGAIRVNVSSHRQVYRNIARQPFCKLYASFPKEHMATLPGKCFASLIQSRLGEYMATLPRNLLAIFMQGSWESIWQCCHASVLASLMWGRFGEYIATLPCNLFTSFMQGSPKGIWQCCQASVLQA